jgi:hypothetical protein
MHALVSVNKNVDCREITSTPSCVEDPENLMTKQIDIHGRRVRLYSLDDGRTWSSSPQSIVAYGQRKTMLRLELQKSFERVDAMPDPVKTVMHQVRH